MDVKTIIEKAFEAAKNSYSPYSKFKVGACIEMRDGNYFLGTNIENAAFGSTMCAERNAVYGAYSNGYGKADIKQLAIVAGSDEIVSPCGACRQVMSELMPQDAQVILLSNKDEIKIYTVSELLPYSFTSEDL